MMRKLLLTAITFMAGSFVLSAEASYDIVPLGKYAWTYQLSDNGCVTGKGDGNAFVYSPEEGMQILKNIPGESSEGWFLWRHWVVGTYFLEPGWPDKEEAQPFVYNLQTKELIELFDLLDLHDLNITGAFPIGVDETGVAAFNIFDGDESQGIVYYDISKKQLQSHAQLLGQEGEVIKMNKKGQILFDSWFYDPNFGDSFLPKGFSAHSLNDHDQVAGIKKDKIFIWNVMENDYVFSEPIPTKYHVILLKINNLGHVIGTLENRDEKVGTFFFDPSKKRIWINDPVNKRETFLSDVNDHDVAVGLSPMKGGMTANAVLWTPEQGLVDLQTLIPSNTKWKKLLFATHINNEGWIAGMGIFEGDWQGFLLIPRPPNFLAP